MRIDPIRFFVRSGLGVAGALASAAIAFANPYFQQQTGATCDTCHRGDMAPSSQTLTTRGNTFRNCGYDPVCAGFPAKSPSSSPNMTIAQPNFAATVPGGSYLNSCTNAHLVDGALEAQCRRADQSIRSSILANPRSCQGDIANVDGQLRCQTANPQPSGGSSWHSIAVSDYKGDRPGKGTWGLGVGYSRSEAEANAMKWCRQYSNDASNCEVEVTYQNQCGAYASSKKNAGTGTGFTRQQAEQNALNSCGKSSCEILKSDCVQ